MTSMRASDFVGQRVKSARTARGWTAKDLAARCAEIGAPEITAPVIANIETGRRDKEGRRRREVTVDETLTLALALEVPPALLFLPLNGDETLQVTPTSEMGVLAAAAWVNGDDAVMRYLSGHAVPRTEEDRMRWAKWRRATRPLELLRNIWLWTEIIAAIQAGHFPKENSELSDVERADQLDVLASTPGASQGADEMPGTSVEQTRAVARLVDWIASLGFTPPPLPRNVVETMRTEKMLEVANPEELLFSDKGA